MTLFPVSLERVGRRRTKARWRGERGAVDERQRRVERVGNGASRWYLKRKGADGRIYSTIRKFQDIFVSYFIIRCVLLISLRKWEIDFWKIREFSGYLLPREWDWYLERVKIGDNIGYVCVVIPIIIISISNSTLEINSVAIIITPLFQTYSVSSQKSS